MVQRFRRNRQKETVVAPKVLEELAEARRAKQEGQEAHQEAIVMHQEAAEIAKQLRTERERNHFAERFIRAMGGGMV